MRSKENLVQQFASSVKSRSFRGHPLDENGRTSEKVTESVKGFCIGDIVDFAGSRGVSISRSVVQKHLMKMTEDGTLSVKIILKLGTNTFLRVFQNCPTTTT